MFQFCNRTGELFDFKNGELSDLVVDPEQTEHKLVDRDFVPEIPGI